MAENQLLVLAQNQSALIQDATKGTVAVMAGPYSFSLSGNDRPVVYDREKDAFRAVDFNAAITQNPLVPENSYLILENPAVNNDGKLVTPSQGNNSPTKLNVGTRIIIAGPTTLALWPGQVAKVVPGHHLRSNQFLKVRVYNAVEAAKTNDAQLKADGDLTPGKLLVIKGTDRPFFIPETGFEVLQENGSYVQEAPTVERLQYVILLDEDGNKRYEEGPQVVFPKATETFVAKEEGGKRTIIFKAIELNDQMGLYIKIIAEEEVDVEIPEGLKECDEFLSEEHKAICVVHDGKTFFKVGEELFVTGKTQRIYYPRPQHALIEYQDPQTKYNRQRYYGVTIPPGEGRYVLDKTKGEIKKVEGPQIFLADPRNEVIVRRVLDPKQVNLWYPGNQEALAFNQSLATLSDISTSYLAENTVLSAAADLSRGINRGTTNSKSFAAAASGSYEGDKLQRGTKFTPPPMLTLSTKYDGIPSIDVWTGYAVQVVNKTGERKIHVGPTTILLEYDESLAVLELSTGKPKNTDTLYRDVYLRVDNNQVSDIIYVTTKDSVRVNIKVSYRVNFLREEQEKWFSVENYVKYMCDHFRSLLKAKAKTVSAMDLLNNDSVIVRDTILGAKNGDEPRTYSFHENGMVVYDVEVLDTAPADEQIAKLQRDTNRKAVEAAFTLAADEQNLEITKRSVKIRSTISDLESSLALHKLEQQQELNRANAETVSQQLEAAIANAKRQQEAELAKHANQQTMATADLEHQKASDAQELEVETKRVELTKGVLGAISPALVQIAADRSDKTLLSQLETAIAPLALHEQQGLAETLEKVTKNTEFGQVIENLKSRTAKTRS